MKEVEDRVTCRMCQTKQSRDLLARHMRDVHKVDRADKGTVFRGFLSLDEISWEPLWLHKGEEDPPVEIMGPVENGQITVYGIKFQVEETMLLEVGSEDGMKDNKSSRDKEVCEAEISDGLMKAPVGVDDTDDMCDMNEALTTIDYLKSPILHNVGEINDLPNRSSVARCLNYIQDELHPEEEDCEEHDIVVDEVGTLDNEANHLPAVNFPGGAAISRDRPKLNVHFFSPVVSGGEFWSASDVEKENDMDSDFEDGDSRDFTESRCEMKNIRLERRNQAELKPKLCDLEENSGIIKEFELFLRSQKFGTSSSGDLSTVRKCLGHACHYPDSLLQFQTNANPNYNLQQHFCPSSPDFLVVKDPTTLGGWIHSSGGKSGKEDPGRRKEQLKAHARWRDFVAEKLEATDFGNTSDMFYKKEIILKNLNKITLNIKKLNLFSQLSKLEAQVRIEKQKAREVIFPQNNFGEQNAVKIWFSSKEALEEEKECMKIYQKSMSGRKVGSKEFLKFSNWTRFTLALEDRNRRSAYTFSNQEFSERKAKWLPGLKDNGDSDLIDKFDQVPDDWNMDVPHQDGEEPSCWVINVSGSTKGMKGGRPAYIILTPRAMEMCLKFRDLKSECMDGVKPDEQFFVNLKGQPLTGIQRTPGSLLFKLGNVCGLGNATVNSFRRAAEARVQASPLMKSSVENLQSHSRRVGLEHYDKTGQNTRASFITQLSQLESPSKAGGEVSDEVKKKRQKIDQEDKEKNLRRAKETLIKDKMSKKEKLSKKCKVVPCDRLFLQKFFNTMEVDHFNPSESFPEDQQWKKTFYRRVDSLADERGSKLRKIEENLFKEVVKFEVEEALGPWTGSAIQNRSADLKISTGIKSSFKSYEKNKQSFEESYFKF